MKLDCADALSFSFSLSCNPLFSFPPAPPTTSSSSSLFPLRGDLLSEMFSRHISISVLDVRCPLGYRRRCRRRRRRSLLPIFNGRFQRPKDRKSRFTKGFTVECTVQCSAVLCSKFSLSLSHSSRTTQHSDKLSNGFVVSYFITVD